MKYITFLLLIILLDQRVFGQKWIIINSEDFSKSINPHTYITSIERNLTTKKVDVSSWSFASKSGIPFFANGTTLFDNSYKIPGISFYAKVTELQWEELFKVKKMWEGKQYWFGLVDCVSFIAEIAKTINLEVPTLNFLPANFVLNLIKLNKDRNIRGWNSLVDAHLFITIKPNQTESTKVLSFAINPKDVTHPTDKQFRWYKWQSSPDYLKIATNQITDSYGKAFSETINFYLNNKDDIYIAAIDLDNDGVAGIVFKTSGKCSESTFGCRFGLWENGGAKTVQLGFLNLGEPIPSTDGIIVGNGDFDPLIDNNAISSTYKTSLSSVFKYSKIEVQEPPASNLVDASLVGGTTPEELGKILLKAVKTNNKSLYKACVHPKPNRTIDETAENFDLLRESFPEQGLTNWSLVKFSRVTFTKDGPMTNDGGTRNGEQVRRNFDIEFTYNNEFAGVIESSTIVTYKGKYFVFSGGGLLRVSRL